MKNLDNLSEKGLSEFFRDFCITGDLSGIKHLINNSYINKQKDIDNGLVFAVMHNQLEATEYLLVSPELKSNASINAHDGRLIMLAAHQKNLGIIKFLSSSPKLVKHVNVHNYNDEFFREIFFDGHDEIMS